MSARDEYVSGKTTKSLNRASHYSLKGSSQIRHCEEIVRGLWLLRADPLTLLIELCLVARNIAWCVVWREFGSWNTLKRRPHHVLVGCVGFLRHHYSDPVASLHMVEDCLLLWREEKRSVDWCAVAELEELSKRWTAFSCVQTGPFIRTWCLYSSIHLHIIGGFFFQLDIERN